MKIRMVVLSLIAVLLSTQFVLAQDRVTTSIAFTISNAGVDVEGTAVAREVDFAFDERDLAKSSIKATVDASTIDTGIEIRNKHLKRADYFDVQHYPDIRIQSIRFERVSKKKVVGVFALTIKNITREIKIPILISKGTYSAAFELNRLDFKLGEESVVLDNVVRVNIKHIGT